MARNQVVPLRDVNIQLYPEGDYRLHFQWCRYDLGEAVEYGYRFMWSAEGRLKPLRGGARIPSWEALQTLLKMAEAEGWAHQSETNI